MVLGIIVLLAAIVTVGVRSALSRVVDSSTKTRLENLNSMLAAYQTADAAGGAAIGRGGVKKLPTMVQAKPGGIFYSTVDSTTSPSATGGAFDNLAALVAQGVHPGPMETPDLYVMHPAIGQTQAVLATLLRVPANQQAFDALPTEAKTGPLPMPPGALLNYQGGVAGPLSPPLLVDGYNHPIIYVPATGLQGLTFKSDPATVVSLAATDGRSFWASAGADGDFTTADDNIYSTPTKIK